MGGASRSFGLIRRSAVPALALIVVGTFAGHAIAGPNGILAWGGYHRALQQRQAELAQLQQEQAELKHRSQLLDPRHADPDLADELARSKLGLVRPDEVIVPLNGRAQPCPGDMASAAGLLPVAGPPLIGEPVPTPERDRRGAFRQEIRRSRD